MNISHKKIGVVKDGSVWPQEISHYVTLKRIKYEESELDEALKEMPDYECWDADKRVLTKEI